MEVTGLDGVEDAVLEELGEPEWVKNATYTDAIIMSPPSCLKDASVLGLT
jgi:hypothetical protein